MNYGRFYSRDIYFNESIGRMLMADVKIEARPNGPYVVTGSIELHDTNGNVLPTQERTVLCRCGASTKKPFCDGTHSRIGFQAAAEAVPDSAEKN
jgi:CDGSH-type Zn-finger protein